MLTNLRLRNLKGLKDTGDLAIKPLTFLVGPNGSGKSSVLQALLMIKQTVDSTDMRNPLLINGPWVEMGSYRDLIHNGNAEESLGIDATASVSSYVESMLSLIPGLIPGHNLASKPSRLLATRASFSETRGGQVSSHDFKFKYARAQSPLPTEILPAGRRTMKNGAERHECWMSSQGLTDVNSENSDITEYKWQCPERKFYNLSGEGMPNDADLAQDATSVDPIATTSVNLIVGSLTHDFESGFKSLYHLGPLRAEPKRVYVASGETPESVGMRGENAIATMLVGRAKSEPSQTVLAEVKRWMSAFGIASDVNLREFGQGYYVVELTDPRTQTAVNLADTGFGASQVLPVIVQGYYAPEDSLILLEQPEIHLHPRAQGALGDLLIDISKRGKKLIVETHSEHLIGRIQTSVAEETISNDDVAIYYFDPVEGGVQARELKLDGMGHLASNGIPEDFFAQGYEESLRHMKAVGRHIRGKSGG